MDSQKTLDNLLALIDSGKEENVEMALQLSVNLSDNWFWIHKYLQAKKRLPKHYVSWYAMYSECVRYNRHHIRVLETWDLENQVRFKMPKETEYSMFEIMEGVTNELHYQLFRIERAKLIAGIVNTDRAIRHMTGPNVTKSTVLKLAEWVSSIIPI